MEAGRGWQGTKSTWESLPRTNEGQELVTLTYGASETLEMVEVTWPPVKRQERHIFIVTGSIFQVAFGALFC